MMRQLLLDIRPIAAPSLNNFVAGANRDLIAHLRTMTGPHPGLSVYLWGDSGSGRTHLLRALAAESVARGLYLEAEQINLTAADTLIAALEATRAGLWLFDDVHLLDTGAQGALFRAINLAQGRGITVVAAGNAAPRELSLREDLRTRIGQMLPFCIQPLHDEERIELLHAHAAARGMKIDPEVFDYLMRHGRRDIRSLLGVLDLLDEHSLTRQRPVTLPLLREVMQTRLI
ncbi:DnaA regulatory inactivator Hda [Methyloversatilis thermotolerans]|uniref:DnaA regulatory inactivator Hda n=1 Tax=Methyloversatilis thermotolerans TaxID=1346290 RepID=UPI00036B2345|nr:DnaA regulatory inactivator Hda [Methyloversatilis thermotolerans]